MNMQPYGPGMRVAGMSPAERRVVADMRRWVGCLRAGTMPPESAPGSAASALDRLLRLLSAAAIRPIDMRDAASATLGADEALLLHAIACAQHGVPEAADRMAEEWLPEIAQALGRRTIADLAHRLARTGTVIPLRADAFSSTRTEFVGPPAQVRLRH